MPDLRHHTPEQYRCPLVIYALLITGGYPGSLLPYAWSTDADELIERAGPVGGIVVQLPVVHCSLPDSKEWLS